MKWEAISLVGLGVVFVAPNARALEDDGSPRGPFGAIHPEAAARVMGGPSLAPFLYNAPGPMGGAWGVRAGASYLGFYGGLSLLDFPGSSWCLTGTLDSCGSDHGTSFGAQVGYGRTLFRLLTIRAVLGLSDYLATLDGTGASCTGASCVTSTSHHASHNLSLEPGVLLAISLGPVLIGADANILYLPSATRPGSSVSSTSAALMLGAQLGVRL